MGSIHAAPREMWVRVRGDGVNPNRGASMRRGLMGWNAEELPVATLEARLTRLPHSDGQGRHGRVRHLHQQHAAERGRLGHRLHAVLVRRLDAGTPHRRAGVRHRAEQRVSEWIRTTDPLSEIVNTPKPGA